MGDEYNKEACEERHKNLHETMSRVDKNVDRLFARLNWFYVLAICTLASAVSAIVLSCIK
jgi:hypothetical protein